MLGLAVSQSLGQTTAHVNVREIYNGMNNITVLLNWTNAQWNGVTIISSPAVSPVVFTKNSSVLLTLSYNTLYNVTVSTTGCGQTSTNVIQLYYSELIMTIAIIISDTWSIL